MDYRKALKQIKAKVTRDFIGAHIPKLLFHNLDHTEKIVSRSGKIGKHYKLEHEPFFILLAAAWFYDIGYLYGECKGHENRSAEIAGTYLAKEGTSSQLIEAIKNTIITASADNQSDNLLVRILYDADLYHLGTKGFFKQNKLAKKEREWESAEKIPKHDWRRQTIDFLETHHFQTDYCQQKLESKKQKNLERLKDKMMKAATVREGTETKMESGTEKKKTEPRKKRPERGIETMFRITSSNHQRLSDMADNKAHIMITANSIIISVMLSILLRKLEDNPQLTIPTIILLTVCVSSMVFGILSTRPSLPHGMFSEEQLDSKQVNLLFFGNFYKMDLASYDHGMRVMMEDPDFLYGSMIRDIYSQGNVLGEKYKHLRLAYSIFMFGIITSVIAFVLASMIN